jgi:hypothetical protein
VSDQPSSSPAPGLDLKLVGVCAVLWLVAGVIVWQNWPDTKKDYYWGNIIQSLEAGRIDHESITALAALTDSIVPSCSHELATHWNPSYRTAVLFVLQETRAAGARELLEHAALRDLDPRVRANALVSLRVRAQQDPSESAPLVKLADEVALGKAADGEPYVRAIAAVILAESGDSRGPVKALLDYAIREGITQGRPFMVKDAALALAKVDPKAPAMVLDNKKRKELLDEILELEHYLKANDVAIVGSELVLAPETSAAVSGVNSQTK